MKAYELQLKVKNACMLNIMRERGFNSAADLSRAACIAQKVIGEMLNLKLSCYNTRHIVRPNVQTVADFLGVLPDELFPQEHLFEPLVKNAFSAQLDRKQMEALTSQPVDPVALLDAAQAEENRSIDKMVDGILTKREMHIIKMRFEEEMKLRDVGDMLGISATRVRQIEQKALRKLRRTDKGYQLIKHSGVIDVEIFENVF